jgi:hypothetical protein
MNREARATGNVLLVFFQDSDSVQEHQFNGMLPVDNTQWQDADWLKI